MTQEVQKKVVYKNIDSIFIHNSLEQFMHQSKESESVSRSVVSCSLQPRGPWPARFLCPWNYPGKNTGGGYHFLLQGIFLTQGSNPDLLGLLHCRQMSHGEAPSIILLQVSY